jgi:hypothetical protein
MLFFCSSPLEYPLFLGISWYNDNAAWEKNEKSILPKGLLCGIILSIEINLYGGVFLKKRCGEEGLMHGGSPGCVDM